MKKHTAITWPLFILMALYGVVGTIGFELWDTLYGGTEIYLPSMINAGLMVITLVLAGLGLMPFALGSQILARAVLLIGSFIMGEPTPSFVFFNIIWIAGLAILLVGKRWAVTVALSCLFAVYLFYLLFNIVSMLQSIVPAVEMPIYFYDWYFMVLKGFLSSTWPSLTSILLVLLYKELVIDEPSPVDQLYRDSLWMNLLYTILSSGFYGMVWLGHLLHNIQVLTGRKFAVTWHLLGYMLVPYYSIYVIYLAQSQLKNYSQYLVTTYQNFALQLPIGTPGIVVASVLGWNIISLPLIQNNMDHLLGHLKPQAS